MAINGRRASIKNRGLCLWQRRKPATLIPNNRIRLLRGRQEGSSAIFHSTRTNYIVALISHKGQWESELIYLRAVCIGRIPNTDVGDERLQRIYCASPHTEREMSFCFPPPAIGTRFISVRRELLPSLSTVQNNENAYTFLSCTHIWLVKPLWKQSIWGRHFLAWFGGKSQRDFSPRVDVL